MSLAEDSCDSFTNCHEKELVILEGSSGEIHPWHCTILQCSCFCLDGTFYHVQWENLHAWFFSADQSVGRHLPYTIISEKLFREKVCTWHVPFIWSISWKTPRHCQQLAKLQFQTLLSFFFVAVLASFLSEITKIVLFPANEIAKIASLQRQNPGLGHLPRNQTAAGRVASSQPVAGGLLRTQTAAGRVRTLLSRLSADLPCSRPVASDLLRSSYTASHLPSARSSPHVLSRYGSAVGGMCNSVRGYFCYFSLKTCYFGQKLP